MPEPERAPRMTDVAALAGVSHQTVSRVVNCAAGIRPATRARVLEAIDQLGYQRNLAARTLAFARGSLSPPAYGETPREVAALAEKVIDVALEEWRASGGTADLEAVFLACAVSVRR